MRYLSLFSGIEAATVAWHPLGWTPAAFAEIDPFASAVLAHHYPEVPNLGDVTKADFDAVGPVDLIVGGSPCQSYSIAGKRLGLDDPRGNLALIMLQVVGRIRPRWLVYENVPGLLSSSGGRDFGTFLGTLAELGYGFAYRVLDAQYFGVPQRRRRVFVIGYLGDWRPPAAVLFERQSLQGNPPPRRKTGARITQALTRSLGAGGADDNRCQANHYVETDLAFGGGNTAGSIEIATACNAKAGTRLDFHTETFIATLPVAHTLRGDGFDAGEDGTGRGTPLVPVAYRTNAKGDVMEQGDRSAALTTQTDPCSQILSMPVSFSSTGAGCWQEGHGTLRARTQESHEHLMALSQAVRRLTPREAERLQGFEDDYTLVPFRGKPAADGNRYKAIGNSMAVPCMAYLGRRIQMVEDILVKAAAQHPAGGSARQAR